MNFWPNTVYVSEDARDDVLTKRVLERLGDVPVTYLPEGQDLLAADVEPTIDDPKRFSQGKRRLLLTRYKGGWLKSCPGTSSHVCCNLWVVNPGEGCPLDCTYCYLQSYLKRNPTLKIYTNVNDMLSTIKEKVNSQPDRLFRIGTGELIDSLVWDDLTDLTKVLVPFFGGLPNAVLELKSKYNNVSNLLDLADVHNGQTVVSWSVNAREVTKKDEAFTARLEERIDAACAVIDAGYRVGLHFDPVIHFTGWEEAYREAVDYIFSRVNPEKVAWVSVSTLRYKRDMQKMMTERFPQSNLPYGEQFLAKDGKLRYFQPLRFKLVNFVWNEIKKIHQDMPVYMCMESSAAWREIAGGAPAAGSELVEVFSKKGKLPIVDSGVTSSCAH